MTQESEVRKWIDTSWNMKLNPVDIPLMDSVRPSELVDPLTIVSLTLILPQTSPWERLRKQSTSLAWIVQWVFFLRSKCLKRHIRKLMEILQWIIETWCTQKDLILEEIDYDSTGN